jgi:hypothetical protein
MVRFCGRRSFRCEHKKIKVAAFKRGRYMKKNERMVKKLLLVIFVGLRMRFRNTGGWKKQKSV